MKDYEQIVQEIYERSDNGRTIIESYYPQSKGKIGTNRKFKIREETAPSCSTIKINGVWCVTDWGDEGKPLNPIGIIMKEDNLNYTDAIKKMAEKFNIIPENKKNMDTWRDKTPEDVVGTMTWEAQDISDKDCKVFGAYVEKQHLIDYGWQRVANYTKVFNDKVLLRKSTEEYPIFVRTCKGYEKGEEEKIYYKFYEPKSQNKNFRFFYYPNGGKIANYINGLRELKEESQHIMSSGGNYRDCSAAVICCGERDSINAYSFGYRPIWFNSETQLPEPQQMKEIQRNCSAIYFVPDIDDTGIKQGRKLALKYPYLRTIWLPLSLKSYKDFRGNPYKDLRDWVSIGNNAFSFKNHAFVARTAEFIRKVISDKGDITYKINPDSLLYFLELNDFGTYEVSANHVIICRVIDGLLVEVDSNDIKQFIIQWMVDNFIHRDAINVLLTSKQIGDSLFVLLNRLPYSRNLPSADIERYRFKNAIIEVNKEKINNIKIKENPLIFLENEKIDHEITLNNEPTFRAIFNELGEVQLIINSVKSPFMQFCINTSRIHWYEEYKESPFNNLDEFYKCCKSITSPYLLEPKNREQIQCLLNKLFVIGYLSSRYKMASRPWAVYAMDNQIAKINDSNGRSGKSLFFKLLSKFNNSISINGRQKKFCENPHIYDRVTESTKMIVVDDIHVSVDIGFFYDDIASDLYINPKRKQSFSIPFEHAPKFVITSNYVPLQIDASTEGRLLYCTFSDYYHIATDGNDYENTHSVFDDFGKNLMTEYSHDEWNEDFNFILSCISFYMQIRESNRKLSPPMDNVKTRRNNVLLGEIFEDWADGFFNEKGSLGELLQKRIVFADFQQYSGKKISSNQFTRNLKLFCKLRGYAYNGEYDVDKTERIIKKDQVSKIAIEWIKISK